MGPNRNRTENTFSFFKLKSVTIRLLLAFQGTFILKHFDVCDMHLVWWISIQRLSYHEGFLAPKSPKRICFHLCNDIADREEAHLMVKRSGLQGASCISGVYFNFSSFTSWWNCYGFYSSEILWINHAAGYAYLGLLNCANWAQQESKAFVW